MTAARRLRPLALALALGALNACAVAQQAQTAPPASPPAPVASPGTGGAAASTGFQPSVGQPGKDVVWVPTPQVLVDRMLDLAKVTPRDVVLDLGSGDGRTVITAVKRGARARGIEYNPDMVQVARRNAAAEGVADRAEFVQADLFKTDLSRATVITMFLLPSINERLRPELLKLAPGTRIVSNTFKMGDWQPDETSQLTASDGCESSWCTALLWIVPARVAGTHQVPQGELVLEQTYQMLTGTLRADGKTVPVEGKVVGDTVVLQAGERALRGRFDGRRLELR